MKFTLGDIAKKIKGKILTGDPEAEITGFSINSRTIKPGEIFIAVKGETFDGHDFIDKAIRNGAKGVIFSNYQHMNEITVANTIKVDCTVETLKCVSSLIRDSVNIPFICVTGTNGKTTVKEILRQILSQKYKVLYSKKSFNNVFGVALTLFDLTKEHEVVILEVGTNSPGEISELAKVIKPTIGIITNVGYGHIAAFNDLEGVLAEKLSLFEHLNEKGLAVINKDDELLSRVSNGKYMTRYFGSNNGCDYFVAGIVKNDNGYKFLINSQEYSLPVYGQHNIYNAAAAVCVADYLGVEHLDIQNALKNIVLPEMRLSRVMADNVLFINDAYNANPDSFLSALNFIKFDVAAPKKGVIAGDMLELGENSNKLHSVVGKRIAALDIDFFIGLGEGASVMIEAAIAAGMPSHKTRKVISHEEAASVLRKFADKESAVLLKGSRKIRMEDVVTCFMNYTTD